MKNLELNTLLHCKYILYIYISSSYSNRFCGLMVTVLASSAVDCGFESRSGQTIDYKIGICCFSTKHAALRRKTKDWLFRNQDNVRVGRHVYPWTVVSAS